MKKTKRDIHKEIMYNKIMPTGHMKRNGFEEYIDENDDTASFSFPEKAEVNPSEYSQNLSSEAAIERKSRMAAEEKRIARQIDSENDNIVKILSAKEQSAVPQKPVQPTPPPAPVREEIPEPAKNVNTEDLQETVRENISELPKPEITDDLQKSVTDVIPEQPAAKEIIPPAEKEIPAVQDIPKPEKKPVIAEPPVVENKKIIADDKPTKKTELSVDDILNEIPDSKSKYSKPKPQLPELVNINEVMINEKIDGILEKFNCCKCPACKLEVIATALNKLSPQYVIKKDENTVPDAISESNYAKINSALINAIITLRANPVHK